MDPVRLRTHPLGIRTLAADEESLIPPPTTFGRFLGSTFSKLTPSLCDKRLPAIQVSAYQYEGTLSRPASSSSCLYLRSHDFEPRLPFPLPISRLQRQVSPASPHFILSPTSCFPLIASHLCITIGTTTTTPLRHAPDKQPCHRPDRGAPWSLYVFKDHRVTETENTYSTYDLAKVR